MKKKTSGGSKGPQGKRFMATPLMQTAAVKARKAICGRGMAQGDEALRVRTRKAVIAAVVTEMRDVRCRNLRAATAYAQQRWIRDILSAAGCLLVTAHESMEVMEEVLKDPAFEDVRTYEDTTPYMVGPRQLAKMIDKALAVKQRKSAKSTPRKTPKRKAGIKRPPKRAKK